MKPAARSAASLVVRLSVGLLVAIAVAAVATYVRARDEANELFDYQLTQMAASLTGVPLAGAPPGSAHGADALVVQIWDRNGVEVYLSQPQQRLPQRAQPGFTTVATDTGEWRVFSTLAGGRVVQVAQPMSVRRELAASMALRTIVPLLVGRPVPRRAAVVRHRARALRRSTASRSRSASGHRDALLPLAEAGLPLEVQPLVHALNGLLGRLDRALDAQRAFIADAAHELRTPLDGRAPAGAARRARDRAPPSARALAELRAGLERATALVEQLLTLAREEPGVERASVRAGRTGRARARRRRRACGDRRRARRRPRDRRRRRPAAADVIVSGDAAGLRTLLANLVDNAVRYTPAGGRVDVAVRRERSDVVVTVTRHRTGHPGQRARARVRPLLPGPRHRRRRCPGSGLGLAIVRRIAERHDATINARAGTARRGGRRARGDGANPRRRPGPGAGHRSSGTRVTGWHTAP